MIPPSRCGREANGNGKRAESVADLAGKPPYRIYPTGDRIVETIRIRCNQNPAYGRHHPRKHLHYQEKYQQGREAAPFRRKKTADATAAEAAAIASSVLSPTRRERKETDAAPTADASVRQAKPAEHASAEPDVSFTKMARTPKRAEFAAQNSTAAPNRQAKDLSLKSADKSPL